MRTDLKWFHISDMHFRGFQSFNRKELANCLLDAARENFAKGWKPDFVAISGDIAYSADQGQYSDATCFLEELLQTLELDRDRVSMCPGNHDIDRSVNHYLFQGCRKAIVSASDIEEFLQSPEQAALLKRLASYREFRETYLTSASQLTLDSRSIHAVNRMIIDGLGVQLWEINSAWLGYGGGEDLEKLVVGSLSLSQSIKSCPPNEGCVVFGIVHHPFHWLASYESDHIEAICCENFDFLLHGHIHKPTTKTMIVNGGRTILLSAGALQQDYERGYQFCFDTYNIADGTLTVESHLYVADERRWYVYTNVLEVEPPSSSSLVATDVYEELLRRQPDFIAPAHMCTVICGIKSEIAFYWNGSPSFYSPVLLQQGEASDVESAVSLRQFQRIIRFYGKNAMNRVFAEHASLIGEYDGFLKREFGADPAFKTNLTAREEEAQTILKTGVADTSATSFIQLGLRRAIATEDMAATLRYLTLVKADNASPIHAEIQRFDVRIADLPEGVSLYETWLESGGSDDFSFTEYCAIIKNLPVDSKPQLVRRTILRCAELYPSESAERLEEIVRNLTSQYGDKTLYEQFKAITDRS